jgi:DNA topoisomerase-3
LQSKTQPPSLLNEAELIRLMDANGIGTDATIAQHIEKILTRGYAIKLDNGLFTPTNLGLSLVEGYNLIGLDFSKPRLRAELETKLKVSSTLCFFVQHS